MNEFTGCPFLSPPSDVRGLRVRKGRRTQRGKVLRLIRIRLALKKLRQLVKTIRRKHIANSSSTKAVNFSSPRTMKRFPSARCASTIQIVRPSESTADTQPQLQPALLRLSAMISQYLTPFTDCFPPPFAMHNTNSFRRASYSPEGFS